MFDSEGDSLYPSKFHCLAYWTKKGGLKVVNDYRDMIDVLLGADALVGHNITRWDKVHLERILGIEIKANIVDTLALSWSMFPTRNRHGIESWGEDFGIQKPPIDDWENLTQEEYNHRCLEDVKITLRLWNMIYSKLKYLYNSDRDCWSYIDYISFKMKCSQLAEESGWKLDVEYCEKELVNLIKDVQPKQDALRKSLPKVPIVETKTRPKRLHKKDGSLTKLGESWYKLLKNKGIPEDSESVDITTGFEEGNPNSHEQIKSWLFSLGWTPTEYKFVKSKTTGIGKEVPQINLPHGGGICPNIKTLYEKEPALEHLEGLSVLNHRIPMLKGFLDTKDKDGFVQAQVNGLTNTLRFQHKHPVVNLPKSEKPYAKAIRGSLIARKNKLLCGADMASLEDRLKQHYIFPLDPEYVKTMLRDDFDPHLELAIMAERVTRQEKEFYQRVDVLLANPDTRESVSKEDIKEYKIIKSIRSIYKNGNYACQYGAGVPRLMMTCDCDKETAQSIHKAYWKLNWAIKKVAESQKISYVGEEMWLLNPINGFYYYLKQRKDVFSTLVQGSASYVFDYWLGFIIKERPQLTGQFHDEIIIEINENARDKANDLLTRAINTTNENLKLNRELGIGIQFGQRYSEIH